MEGFEGGRGSRWVVERWGRERKSRGLSKVVEPALSNRVVQGNYLLNAILK